MALFSLASCNVEDLFGRVEISAPGNTVPVGGTLLLEATFLAPGTTEVVTTTADWRSDDINIASVVAGVVTGKSQGSTTVFARYNDIVGSFSITVTASSTPETFSLNTSLFDVAINGNFKLVGLSNLLGDVSGSTFWTSSNPGVVNVDLQGLVSGVAVGTATVTAIYNGMTATANVTVTDSLTLNTTSINLSVSGTHQLLATSGANGDVTGLAVWSTSNFGVAAVSAGLVTAQGTGTATITATYNGVSASATVLVGVSLTSITVTPASPTVNVGASVQFTAMGAYSDSSTVNLTSSVAWSSSNASALLHNGGGNFTGNTPNASVTITATDIATGMSGSTTAAVVGTLTLSANSINLPVSGTHQLLATSAANSDVTGLAVWSTSNFGVASVIGGLVTAQGTGAATITATYNGVSASATVLVGVSLTSITVTPASITVDAGASVQFTATGTYSNSSTMDITSAVTWSSSNATAVSHNGGGSFTGNTPNAVVTITAMDGATSGATSLTVNDQLVGIAVTPASSPVNGGSTVQFTAMGTKYSGATINLTNAVTWGTSNGSIVTISGSGLATAVGVGGPVTITSTYGATGISGTATLTVNDQLVGIAVTPASTTVDTNANIQFAATGTRYSGATVLLTSTAVWSSSNATAVSHNGGGNFKGNTPNATVTVTATDSPTSVSGTASLTVNNQLVSIAVTPNSPTRTESWQSKFAATGTYADGSQTDQTGSATWSSDNTGIAFHNAGGVFHFEGSAEGTVNITAMGGGGVSGSTTLTVINPLVGLAVSAVPGPQPQPGTRQQLNAFGTFFNSTTKNLTPVATWSSLNTSVAMVTSNSGGVTIVGPGTINIMAMLGKFAPALSDTVQPLTPGGVDLIIDLELVADNHNGTVDVAFSITNVGDTTMPLQNVNVDFFENETVPPPVNTGYYGNSLSSPYISLAPGQSYTDVVIHTLLGSTSGNFYAVVDTDNLNGDVALANNVSGALQWGVGSPNAIFLEAFPNNSFTGFEDTYFDVFASDGVTLLDWNDDHVFFTSLFSGMEIYMQPGRVPFLRVTPLTSSSLGGYSLWAATYLNGFTGSSTGIVVDPDAFEPDNGPIGATFLPLNTVQDHYMENGSDWFRFMIPGP